MADAGAWLDPALDYIRAWMAYQMRATEQPGCAIAVIHAGEVVLEAAFGHASLAAAEPLTPRHRFRVASHSKTFTATAVMLLRERGLVKLDDRAGDHVEGLHPDVAAATLAQLLSHTAGVARDGPDCAYWVDRAAFLDEGGLRAELAIPPVIEPSTRLKYSNHGFGLLGLVIEAVTGEPYAAWVQREVVANAGLQETSPDGPPPAGSAFACGHGGKALLGRRLTFPGGQPTNALAPATGFVSTAGDLARFFDQLSPDAKRSVLSKASRREMSHARWQDPWSAAPAWYGLGTISGTFDGWEWFGHTGGFLGYVTRTLVVPAQDLAVSCLTNAVDGMAHLWLDGALAILKRFQEGGAPTAVLADWRGRWWSAWGPTDLVAVGERVLLATPGAANPFLRVSELTVAEPRHARISQAGGFGSFGESAELLLGPDGAVTEVLLGGTRLVDEAALTAELVGRYEGGAAGRPPS